MGPHRLRSRLTVSRHFHIDQRLENLLPVSLDGSRFVRVLRKKVGDTIVVCDRDGRLFEIALTSTDPCEGIVQAQLPDPGADALDDVVVWLPLLKGGRTDDLVRQLTELGVTEIIPFQSQHSVVRLDGKKAKERQARFQAIATEAANQCGRLRVPRLAGLENRAPDERPGGAVECPGVFFWEVEGRAVDELRTLVGQAGPSPTPRRRVSILFGPEGGIADDEAARLIAAGWTAFSLGPRILRAETAVVVGTALVQAALGALV